MKTRLDFVSNSSSSSYIIAVEDNPHMMVLNDPMLLTFKELVDKFGHRLFCPSAYREFPVVEVSDDEFIKRFMDDAVFIDSENGKCCTYMPHSAIYLYAVHAALKNEHDSKSWINIKNELNGDFVASSEEYDSLSEFYVRLMQNTDAAISKACYDVLEPKLKDMRFCYQEVTDDYRGYWNDADDNPFDQSADPDSPRKRGMPKAEEVMLNRKYQTYYESLDQPHDECLVEARINLLEKLNGPFKFKRIFSNH